MLDEIKSWIVEFGHTILEEIPEGTKGNKYGALVLDGESDYWTIKPNRNGTYYIATVDCVEASHATFEEAKKILEII